MNEQHPTVTSHPDAQIHPLVRGLLLFAPISLFCNEIGSLVRYPEVGAAVLFLPYAALTAALVVAPRRDWVWYVLIDTAMHFASHWPHWSLSWVLLANVANIAARAHGRGDAARGVRWYSAPGQHFCPAAVRHRRRAARARRRCDTWRREHRASRRLRQLLADVEGMVHLECTDGFDDPAGVPAVLMRRASKGRPHITRRVVEALLLAVALVATCAVAFFLPSDPRWPPVLPLYLPLPILIWAALRFGSGGASVALAAVAVAAIFSVDSGSAPSRTRRATTRCSRCRRSSC